MKLILFSLFIFQIISTAQIDTTIINDEDSSFTLSDTLSVISPKPDTLIPIFNKPLFDKSSFISNEKIINTNYRYTGDVISLSPVSSIRDYGFVGYPNTLSLYGNVPNSVSILKDGLMLNERFMNYFNLNMLQTEEIDSIEIIPLPRGALYSSYLNPTSANIITKDFLPTEPYSKIKYYQGPDREALINGYFNAEVLKKLFFTFSVTNRIKDETYRNNDFSIWQGNFRFKYLLSNQLNLIFSYDLNDYKLGYNGGVDYDSVLKLTSKTEDLLYDPIAAPVLLPNGEIKLSSQMPRLTLKSKFFNWLNSDLSIFYLFNKSEQKTFRYGYNEDKVLGIHSDNKLIFNNMELRLLLDYEKIKDYVVREIYYDNFINTSNLIYLSKSKINSDLFSVGSYVTLKPFSEKFSLSLFYKTSRLKENRESEIIETPGLIKHVFINYVNNLQNSSVGIDLNTNISEKISVYLGYALIGKYLSKTDLKYLLFESSIKYKDELVDANFRYFINEFNNTTYIANPRFPTFYYTTSFGDLSGISIDINLNYKFLLLESRTNYFWKAEQKKLYNLPSYTSRNGIYYYDKMFNNNLDLKTGIIINLIGNQLTISEFRNSFSEIETKPVQTIDFTLSGTIQKKATLYFVWENLSNKKYFLVPYFPMPERNIRFGVSWEFLN